VRVGRIDTGDRQTWAVLDSEAEEARPLSGPIGGWGPALLDEPDRATAVLRSGIPLPLHEIRLLPPVEPTGRVLGVGMNYLEHLHKLGAERPPYPMCWLKPHSALVPPDGVMAYPITTEQYDYEVELVLVIGRDEPRPGRSPGDRVLGYTVGNDGSARDAVSPIGGLDLFGMKALDATTPLGPWVTTVDELGAPTGLDLEISLRVNGELRQKARTSDMIFDIDAILDYLDHRVRLRAGDVVFTGTTGGVGLEDGRFLQPGDVVEAAAEGVGVLRSTVGPRPLGQRRNGK
jgi:2-keto-4-pentenoate hydratase/2-oxohepta-3-ene-1,7-dioic acid hydratase in catechol pathway